MKSTCSNCQGVNDINSKYCSLCGFKMPILENQTDEVKIVSKKKEIENKKYDMKTFIGFIIGFVVMFFVSQSLLKPSFDKKLVEFADEFNKNCPMVVNQYTTLKNISALPNKTIQYNYILVGVTKEKVKIDTLKKYLFSNVLRYVKTNPEMKFFRENEVTLNYYYSDNNGNFVTKYSVKPEMYEE